MKSPGQLIGGAVAALAALIVLLGAVYTVDMTEQVIVTQFGKPVGGAVTNAGLHFKLPFIQEIHRLDKRVILWDDRPNEMPTKEKTYIIVDAFGRWRIKDPTQYFLRLRDERSAMSRLDDILGSEIRNAVAKHELIEVIRSTRDRVPQRDETLQNISTNFGVLYPIREGRAKVEREIFTNAAPKLVDFGIELMDIQFKRINYNQAVRTRIFERMISERQQIAARYRSEGEGEALKISGQKEKDLAEIESTAYRKIQEIMGAADAKATEIYARAYNQSPESAAFYEFVKSLEAYEAMLGRDTTLILTTESDLFKFLKRSEPVVPAK